MPTCINIGTLEIHVYAIKLIGIKSKNVEERITIKKRMEKGWTETNGDAKKLKKVKSFLQWMTKK